MRSRCVQIIFYHRGFDNNRSGGHRTSGRITGCDVFASLRPLESPRAFSTTGVSDGVLASLLCGGKSLHTWDEARAGLSHASTIQQPVLHATPRHATPRRTHHANALSHGGHTHIVRLAQRGELQWALASVCASETESRPSNALVPTVDTLNV